MTAKPLLEKALSLSPNIRIAHLDLGIIYAEQQRNEQAVVELSEALLIDPSRPDVHYRLGRVYQEMGRQREAQAELAIVKRLHKEKTEDALHQVSGAPPALPVQ